MTEMTDARPAATPRIVELPERQTAIVWIEGPTTDMPAMMAEAFALTAGAIQDSGGAFAGEPFARYHGFGEQIRAEVGFPFVGTLRPTERVHSSSLPGGRAVTVTHVGPYDELAAAWERGQAFIREHDLVVAGAPWECYLTGPDAPGPHVTEIFFPLR